METAPDFFQTPPHHPAPHPEKSPSLHTPQQIGNGKKKKKKVVLKLSSPPLLSVPAFPRAPDRVDSSGACLWKEGRAMGVFAASLGCWEELDRLVRASWSGSGAPAPCPTNPFRLGYGECRGWDGAAPGKVSRGVSPDFRVVDLANCCLLHSLLQPVLLPS